MIVNYRDKETQAHLYRVLDLDTGKDLDLPVWYADDAAGEVRVYTNFNEDGPKARPHVFRVDPITSRVISETLTRRIRIVPRNETREALPTCAAPPPAARSTP